MSAPAPTASTVTHKHAVGDKVVFVNDFGVCWGVKTISALDERTNKPTYHYEDSDTPWFSSAEEHFHPATAEDLQATRAQLQAKYGFTPTEWYGCY